MSGRNIFAAIGASIAILAALPVACKGSSSHHATASTSDAEADGAFGDGEPDSAAATSFLRLANWAPDAVFDVDVCVTTDADPEAGTWVGPLLGAGVSVPKVSGYVAVPPDASAVRVIPAGKGCGAPLAPDSQLPSLAAGGYATVALLGEIVATGANQHAQVHAFADDAVGIQGQAAVRFINALAGGSAVVFGTGATASATFSPLTASVPLGSASFMSASGIAVDPNGYLLLDPQSTVTVSARNPDSQSSLLPGSGPSLFDAGLINPAGSGFGIGADLATGSGAAWPASSVVTVALIDSDFGVAQEFLFCLDGVLAQTSMATCSVLSN